MKLSLILQPISIFLEFTAMILGILIATQKKKNYGWCIVIVFAIYVFYDTVNFLNTNKIASINLPMWLLPIAFFIATISILWVVWKIYSE